MVNFDVENLFVHTKCVFIEFMEMLSNTGRRREKECVQSERSFLQSNGQNQETLTKPSLVTISLLEIKPSPLKINISKIIRTLVKVKHFIACSSSSISSLGSVRFCLFVYVYDANFVLKSLQMVDLIGFSRFTNSFLLFLHLAVSFFHYYYYFRYV